MLERSGDPAGLSVLRPHLESLASTEAASAAEPANGDQQADSSGDSSLAWTAACLESACVVTLRLVEFLSQYSGSYLRGMSGKCGAGGRASASALAAAPLPAWAVKRAAGPARRIRSPDRNFT